jgi:hypothetical protein
MFSSIEESEENKMAKCPYCNAEIDFQDEFTSFDDQGDCIVATGSYTCECGETLTVRATFVWDGEVEVE